MLRWLVALLALANLLFWVWNEGWLLSAVGLGPMPQREPGRLAQQVQADSIRVLPPEAARAALAAASAAVAARDATVAAQRSSLQCLEAGPFTAATLPAAEQALAAALPGHEWVRASREVGPQFAVFIGPLAGRDAIQKKEGELRTLKLAYETLVAPGDHDSGLSLGRFDSRPAAEKALEGYASRGVRTARVIALREAGTEWRLRVDNAPPPMAEQLRALSVPGGASFAACAG
jgi:hypothetical protein